MNEIVNTFLLEGDKSMPEMHLRQPGFTYSACGLTCGFTYSAFTKNKERIQKFKETGDSRYIHELDKACFHHDMAYGDLLRVHGQKLYGRRP